MADRDPNRPQLDFPDLVADLIAQLRLTGQVGLLDFSDQVTPVYIVAQRAGALTVDVAAVTYAAAEIFHGQAWNVAANTVLADTGALAAGTYDLRLQLACTSRTPLIPTAFVIEHRNAANAATLAVLLSQPIGVGDIGYSEQTSTFGYTIDLNERLRIITPSQVMVGGLSGEIFARLRPTP